MKGPVVTEPTTHDFAQTVVDAAASASKAVTYGGGATSALGGFVLSSEITALMGLLVALIGLAMNLYFNAHRRRLDVKRDRREEREHRARMAVIERVNGSD